MASLPGRHALLASSMLAASCNSHSAPIPVEPQRMPDPSRVMQTPAQLLPAQLLLRQDQVVSLGAARLSQDPVAGGMHHETDVESPRGLGLTASGGLVVVDAPAAYPGRLRVRHWDAGIETEASEYISASPLSAASSLFVLAGVGADVWLLSWEAPAGLSRVRLMPESGRMAMLNFQPITSQDSRAVARLDNGSVLMARSGQLLTWKTDQRESLARPLPEEARTPLHLAAGDAEHLWASGADGILRGLSIGSDTISVTTRTPLSGGRIFALSAADGMAMVLTLDEDPVGTQKWGLAGVESGGALRWQIPLEGPRRAADTFIAVSDEHVVVSGGEALVVLDRETGTPR